MRFRSGAGKASEAAYCCPARQPPPAPAPGKQPLTGTVLQLLGVLAAATHWRRLATAHRAVHQVQRLLPAVAGCQRDAQPRRLACRAEGKAALGQGLPRAPPSSAVGFTTAPPTAAAHRSRNSSTGERQPAQPPLPPARCPRSPRPPTRHSGHSHSVDPMARLVSPTQRTW